MEKREIRPPQKKNPEPIVTEICMGDYVWDPYPMQNFITIWLPLYVPQICENLHQVTRLVFWRTPSTPEPIYTVDTSNDVVSRKDVPFVISKTKFYISTPFFPQNGNFGPIFVGT